MKTENTNVQSSFKRVAGRAVHAVTERVKTMYNKAYDSIPFLTKFIMGGTLCGLGCCAFAGVYAISQAPIEQVQGFLFAAQATALASASIGILSEFIHQGQKMFGSAMQTAEVRTQARAQKKKNMRNV